MATPKRSGIDPEISLIASMLGRRGGRKTSPQKVRAARLNGQRGGRPRKLKFTLSS